MDWKSERLANLFHDALVPFTERRIIYMKILHCCLSNFYIDNYGYQENLLPIYNLKHGHEVEIIASTETFVDNNHLGYLKPGQYYTREGIKVTRVPYRKMLPHFAMKKIRSYRGVYQLIDNFKPNVILFHGMGAYELTTVVKYVKKNPAVKLYVDNHADYNNSGRNWISRKFLHEIFYRRIVQRSLSYIEKIFFITSETSTFILQEYIVPETKLEFLPLGGILIPDQEREADRRLVRNQLGIREHTLVLMHSGKMDQLKRTDVIIDALKRIDNSDVCLLLAGEIPNENRELKELIQSDERIKWLGWLEPEGLRKYLCASDVYVQPGSQSATLQQAVCCGLSLMLYPHASYLDLLKCSENMLWVRDSNDIKKSIIKLQNNVALLEKLKNNSLKTARNTLSYDILAKRIEE